MKNKMLVSKNDQPKWPAWPEFDRSSPRSGRTLSVDQPLFSALKKLNRGQLLSPAACMLINKVSDDACQWNGHDVVISIGGIFFIECYICCMTPRKAEHSVTLQQQFLPLCTRLLFVANTLTVWFCSTTEGVSAVLLSFMCLWNVPGGGLWSPEWTS